MQALHRLALERIGRMRSSFSFFYLLSAICYVREAEAIELSEEERGVLHRRATARSGKRNEAQRAGVILHAAAGMTNRESAGSLGCTTTPWARPARALSGSDWEHSGTGRTAGASPPSRPSSRANLE
jgi:hypothetical protein